MSPGTIVRVRDAWPELDGPAHIRTPHYVRGRIGTVLACLGRFPNPEDIAFNRPAPLLPLYHVGFSLEELWGDPSPDFLSVEIYGPWLEDAS